MDNESLKNCFIKSIKNGEVDEVLFFGYRIDDLDFTCPEVMDALTTACEQGYIETLRNVLTLIVEDDFGMENISINFDKIKPFTLFIENAGVEAGKMAVIRLAIASQEIFDMYSKEIDNVIKKGKSVNSKGQLVYTTSIEKLVLAMLDELNKIQHSPVDKAT